MLSSEDHLAFLNHQVFPEEYYHYAEEVVSVFNLCIYLHRQSCLTRDVDNYILKFRSVGLLDNWVKKFVDRSYLKERTSTGPKVLVNEQLVGAYELLGFGMASGAIIFMVEVISTYFHSLRKFVHN